MDIDLAVLADAANISIEGKLNIVGIFRNILMQKIPGPLPKFYLAVALTPENTEIGIDHKFEIHFRKLEEEIFTVVAEGSFSIQRPLEYNYPMMNFLLGMEGIQVPETGIYSFEFVIEGFVKKTIPLIVSTQVNTQPNLLNPPK